MLLSSGLGQASIITSTTLDAGTGVVASTSGENVFFGPVALDLLQFDSGLGSLNSVTVAMNYVYTVDLVTTDGGSASLSGGGDFSLGGVAYGGTGCGNGGSTGSDGVTFVVTCGNTNQVWAAGGNPAILATVQGTGTVTWLWGDSSLFNLSSDGGTATASLTLGSATITYDFTAAPAPEPGGGLLILTALGLGIAGKAKRWRGQR
jgi:hypothetical protein